MEWTVDKHATERLYLAGGDQWIDVRKQLSVGEERAIARASAKAYQDAGEGSGHVRMEYDVTKFGLVQAAAYIVAWSAPIPIPANYSLEKKIQIIENLHPSAQSAIEEAIAEYLKQREEARAAEKKDQPIASGELSSTATSA